MELLLIDRDDFTGYRTITENINDMKRLTPYIVEAQRLDFLGLIGRSFYEDLITTYGSYLTDYAYNNTDPAPDPLRVYTDKQLAFKRLVEGEGDFYSGIKPVLVYLSFGRFVRSDNMRSTPSGFVQKNTDFSTPISSKQISEMAQRSEADATAFMGFVWDWMKTDDYFKTYDYNGDGCCDSGPGRRTGGLGAARNKYGLKRRVR